MGNSGGETEIQEIPDNVQGSFPLNHINKPFKCQNSSNHEWFFFVHCFCFRGRITNNFGVALKETDPTSPTQYYYFQSLANYY